ncbi:MAG: cell division protein CrgA [Actinobacteria bacterium]|nr:cell division protein CrgA [Actinomycetota bacterium]
MPKSKSRSKREGQRYQLEPARKQARKSSPGWYGPVVLGVMALGVIVILLNYVGKVPGSTGTESGYLFLGLGLILVGFVGSTFWR